MPKYNTSGLIDAVLYQNRMLPEDGASETDNLVALRMMQRMEKSATYCWREIRGKRNASTNYLDFNVLIFTTAGRTMVTLSKNNEDVTFVGASDGIFVGSHGLSVDSLESLHSFAEALESFAEVCTSEMILEDHGLSIAV